MSGETTLKNYRDISRRGSDTRAGFQFEFCCESCSRTWQSPFKPYRKGQVSGFIYRFAHYFDTRGTMSRASNTFAEAGANRARDEALEEALELARERYAECTACRKTVCEDCWNPQTQTCEDCSGRSTGRSAGNGREAGAGSGQAAASGAPLKCPNCSTPNAGGRFCAECGFDMASSHKSCPGCGAMCLRSARFCTDCGHGF